MDKAAAYLLIAGMQSSTKVTSYTEFKKQAQTVSDIDVGYSPEEAAAYHKAVEEANRISDPETYVINDENDFYDDGPTYLERQQQEMEEARAALGFGPLEEYDGPDANLPPGEFGEDLTQPLPVTPSAPRQLTPVEQARYNNPNMHISNTGVFRQTGVLPNGTNFVQAGNNINTIKTPSQMMNGGRTVPRNASMKQLSPAGNKPQPSARAQGK